MSNFEREIETPTITFNCGDKPILVITEDKFIFKGVEIDDAGEAYKAFIETQEMMKNSMS